MAMAIMRDSEGRGPLRRLRLWRIQRTAYLRAMWMLWRRGQLSPRTHTGPSSELSRDQFRNLLVAGNVDGVRRTGGSRVEVGSAASLAEALEDPQYDHGA